MEISQVLLKRAGTLPCMPKYGNIMNECLKSKCFEINKTPFFICFESHI